MWLRYAEPACESFYTSKPNVKMCMTPRLTTAQQFICEKSFAKSITRYCHRIDAKDLHCFFEHKCSAKNNICAAFVDAGDRTSGHDIRCGDDLLDGSADFISC